MMISVFVLGGAIRRMVFQMLSSWTDVYPDVMFLDVWLPRCYVPGRMVIQKLCWTNGYPDVMFLDYSYPGRVRSCLMKYKLLL